MHVKTLFNSPLGWAATFVGTWTRFWLMAIVCVAVVACIVFSAAAAGWLAALGGGAAGWLAVSGVAILSAAFQVMLLYALRRLLMHISGEDGRQD